MNHFAESDAEAMDELSLLVSQQQAMLATLKVQKQELASNKEDLERERQTLTAYQEQLEQQKEELAKQMQELESERLSAAEILQIAEEQKKNFRTNATTSYFKWKFIEWRGCERNRFYDSISNRIC